MLGRRGLLGGLLAMGMPRRPDQHYSPPTAVTPPSPSSGVFRGRLVILSAASGSTSVVGLFEYVGTPALGNPPVAWAAPPGVAVDPFGNALPVSTGGFVANNTSSLAWAQLVAAGASAGLKMSDPAGLLWSIATTDISSVSYVEILGAAGSQSMFIAGITGSLVVVGNNPGAVTGTPETWHTIVPVAGFTAGTTTPRYRFEPVGSGGVVRLAGVVALTANQAANTTFFTLPAGYHPAVAQNPLVGSNLSGVTAIAADLTISTAGVMQIAQAGSTGNVIVFDGVTFPLD